MKIKSLRLALVVLVPLLLASCGSSTAPTTYTISGTVTGLNGTGLVLQYNNANNLSVTSNGPFTFANAIVAASAYTVTVLTQPNNPAQTCTVTSGGTGTANSDIVIVEVFCANNTFTLGGTVTGLSGSGLVLQDNGGSNLTVGANGSFSFPTTVSRGSSFDVTVLTQPSNPAQTCSVTNGVGTNLNANATDILVTCYTTAVTYTIGGTVSGLSGSGLVLQDNSGDNLAVNANGSFTFATPIPSGGIYSVTVLTQPASPSQTCAVAAGSGTANANITGIHVTCTTTTYPIGGTITGLTGSGLVLQDNGASNLAVSAGATTFTFATQVASGSNYAVTILTQPSSGPSCAVTGGSGTVGNSSVSSIAISCTGSSANISATVTGLPANTSVVLQDKGADNLTIATNGLATNFNTPIAANAAYAVIVQAQPEGATCTVGANGTGEAASASINVAVTCGDPISAGDAHACAVTAAGGVLCWGANDFGQLGNGATATPANPVSVVGLPATASVVSVAAGSKYTCALTSSGSVWCWGDNSAGQLGDGAFTQSSVAVQVLNSAGDAPLSGVIAIAAGQNHTCAVAGDGGALCWGDNSHGELGNGSSLGSNLPVPVSGLTSSVAAISAGSYFSCAVTTGETALCWGQGTSGQLGSGNSIDAAVPTAVVAGSTDNTPLNGVVAISAGVENSCALTTSGTAFCWGANSSGQLGHGTTGAASSVPVTVLNPVGQSALDGVATVKGGLDDFCAVTSAGSAYCWGVNQRSQIGESDSAGSNLPAQVSLVPGDVMAIATGYHQTCALTNAGAALCWALSGGGQTSGANTPSSPAP